MGTNYGTFTGNWSEYQPNWISGNTLWLDGSDGDNVIVDTSNNVGAFVDKSNKNYGTVINDSTWLNYNLDSFTDASETGFKAVKTGTGGSLWDGAYIQKNQGSDRVELWEFDITINSYTGSGVRVGFGTTSAPSFTITQNEVWITESGHYAINFMIVGGGDSSSRYWFAVHYDDTADFEVSNISIREDQSNNFIQSATAAQPTYISSASTLTFDGVQEFLDGSANIANFTGDTQGEIIAVWQPSGGTYNYVMTFSDQSSTTEYFQFRRESTVSNGIAQLQNNGGGNKFLYQGIANVPNSTTYLVNLTSNGVDNDIYLDGSRLPSYSVDTVGGNWLSYNNGLDVVRLASAKTSAAEYFTPTALYEVIYYNRQLTDRERRAIFKYLNTKYSIY